MEVTEVTNQLSMDNAICDSPVHCGTKPGHFETSIIHFPTSEEVSEESEQANE